MTWYLRREWVDQEDGIENVLIHYTWSPPGGWPDWERNHNARMLADAGGFPRRRAGRSSGCPAGCTTSTVAA